MTGPCSKCAGVVWEGPKLVHYNNGIMYRGWPFHEDGAPHSEALMFKCSRCGYCYLQATVDRGGPIPTPPPAPKPRSEHTD
jgi:hypothetical protein